MTIDQRGYHVIISCLYNMAAYALPLQWRHNDRVDVSNHQPNSLLKCLFRRRSKKTSKLCVIGLCAWNSLVTGGFPAQRASNAENVSIWWRHHDKMSYESYTHRSHSSSATPLRFAHYNSTEDIIQLTDLDCEGDENYWQMCEYEEDHECQHDWDAGVMCRRES